MNDSASKLKGLMWVVAACLVGAILALGLSPLAHAIPFSWEDKIAYAIGSDFSAPECTGNPQAQELLQKLVQRIYPVYPEDAAFTIHVRMAQDNTINAYAELGGKITVNSGLLKHAQSPEELAGVLAHEIGHVKHHHIMQGVITHMFTAQGISMIFSGGSSSMAEWTNYFLNMSFTRSQEAQADEAGLERLQTAHVDNRGFRHFFERMEESDSAVAFISDHPSNSSRLEMIEKFTNRDVRPILTQDDWKTLKNYCGDK